MKNRAFAKILSLLLLLGVLFSLASCEKILEFAIGNYTFEYEEVEGGYEVRAAFQNYGIFIKVSAIDLNDLVMDIPSEYKGKPVVSIADDAFKNYAYIYKVNIPDTVKRIGDSAFEGCYILSECIIPEGVEYIGDSAFRDCFYLKDIAIPDGVKTIGDYAFHSSAWLIDEIWGQSVTEKLNEVPFLRRDVMNIEIPASVTDIGEGAFGHVTSVKSFIVDEDNPSYKSENGVLYSKDGTVLLQYPLAAEDEVFDLPEGVKSIEDYAFAYSLYLKDFNAPENSELKKIGNCAFYHSEALATLDIPANVEHVGDYAIAKCIYLSDLSIGNPNVIFGERVLYDAPMLYSIHYSGTMRQFKDLLTNQRSFWVDSMINMCTVYCSNGLLLVNGEGAIISQVKL